MARKYLAFDIETAREVPGEGFDWKPHRPLGICCAAALRQDSDEPIIWHGRDAGGNTAARMSQAETAHMVSELVRFASQGCTLLTWNGLAFDLDILAEESGRAAECKALATAQVDMMFHVVCAKGTPPWRTTAVWTPSPNRLKLICEMKPLRPSFPQDDAVSERRTRLGTGIGDPPSTTIEMSSFGGHFQPEK